MSSCCAAIQLKVQGLQRRLEEVERKAGSADMSSPCVTIQLKNQELQRRQDEVEQNTCSTGTRSPCVAIQLKNQELEQRLEEIERKAGSADMSSSCVTIQLKNQELQRRQDEVEQNTCSTGTRSPCVAIQLKNQELEQRLEEIERKASSMDTRSIEIHQKSEELDQKFVELWKAAGMVQTERLKKLMTASQELDLAFLVDATGSMGEVLVSIKDQAGKIAAEVKKKWPELKLRVAFAPYRDYDEKQQDDDETCDFTEEFEGVNSVFVRALSRLNPSGGYCDRKGGRGCDIAEDVFSGLERAAQFLSWKSRTRLLVHIADAPCHGKQFHNFNPSDKNMDELSEQGDLRERSIGTLLRALREDRKIFRYLFCHIDYNMTETMISEFKNECGDKDWIQDLTVQKDLSDFLDAVVEMCNTSISQSMEVDSGLVVSNFYNLDVEPELPFSTEKWETIPCEEATQIIYKLPDSLEDLFDALATNGKLKMKESTDLWIQIRPNPFSGEESVSWPHYALVYQPTSESTTGPSHAIVPMVVKQFKIPQGQQEKEIHAKEAYLEQMEVQTVAAKMADEFNKELESVAIGGRVQFTMVSTLRVGTKFYNMGKAETGSWVRYCDTPILHAFSHWTYHRSKGLLVVNDFQGIETTGTDVSKGIWLCDPSLHCKDPLRYQTTKKNWGEPGMKHFLETHKCNDICQTLKLPSS